MTTTTEADREINSRFQAMQEAKRLKDQRDWLTRQLSQAEQHKANAVRHQDWASVKHYAQRCRDFTRKLTALDQREFSL
jgi:hypothetical protein